MPALVERDIEIEQLHLVHIKLIALLKELRRQCKPNDNSTGWDVVSAIEQYILSALFVEKTRQEEINER